MDVNATPGSDISQVVPGAPAAASTENAAQTAWKEPEAVVLAASAVAVTAAVLGVVTSFGGHLTDTQVSAIEHLIETLAGVAGIFIFARR